MKSSLCRMCIQKVKRNRFGRIHNYDAITLIDTTWFREASFSQRRHPVSIISGVICLYFSTLRFWRLEEQELSPTRIYGLLTQLLYAYRRPVARGIARFRVILHGRTTVSPRSYVRPNARRVPPPSAKTASTKPGKRSSNTASTTT